MPNRTLTSRANPLARLIKLVADQARRAPADLVLVEGVRALREALAARLAFEAVVITDQYGSSERELALLDDLERLPAKVYRASESLLRQLSDVQAPQGILALVRSPLCALEEVTLPELPLVLCACSIQDPGNLGTLIRTAAAAGASLVCCLTGTVSARNPKTIRASAGAVFHLTVVEKVSAPRFLEYCSRHRLTVLYASAHDGSSCYRVDLARPCAILLGNEGSGIDATLRSGLTAVRIPMRPGIESLNVAAAGAVLLFEAQRQRSAAD